MPVDPNADRAGSKSPRGNGVHNKRSAFQCPAEKHGSRPVVPLVVRLHVLLLHPGAYLKLSDFYVFRSRLSQEHVLVPRPRVPMRCNSRCCYCSQPCFDAFEGADFPVYVRLTRGPPSPLCPQLLVQIWDIAKYARVTQSIIVYPPKHVVFLPRMVPSTEVEFVSTGKG